MSRFMPGICTEPTHSHIGRHARTCMHKRNAHHQARAHRKWLATNALGGTARTPVLVLILRPPVSYMMPLPAMATTGTSAFASACRKVPHRVSLQQMEAVQALTGMYVRMASAGRCSAAWPTLQHHTGSVSDVHACNTHPRYHTHLHKPPKPRSRKSVPWIVSSVTQSDSPNPAICSFTYAMYASECNTFVGMSTSAAAPRAPSCAGMCHPMLQATTKRQAMHVPR